MYVTCILPHGESILSHLQGFNILTDLVLAIFPSLVVSNLNMRLRTKMGLIFLMGLGIL